MSPEFDAACRSAIDLAKSALPDGARLDAIPLLDALYHGTDLKRRLPDVARYFETPQPRRAPPEKVPVAETLKLILRPFKKRKRPVPAEELFLAILESEAGRGSLHTRGMPEASLAEVKASLKPAPGGWKGSPERRKAMAALGAFGRMLTEQEPPDRGRTEMQEPLGELITALSRMGKRSAILTGYPGTGKTALIYELARRIVRRHDSIPQRLHDCDVFELSPTFLRSGASVVGQYEERIKALIEVLTRHPKILLFVDEIHSMFSSGMHGGGPFSEANEVFKGVLGRGEITCIGCTTVAEYRHYIEPDKALARRFVEIRLQPPSAEKTLKILESRLPRVEQHYAPLRVPRSALEKTVELGEEYLAGRYQPDKSIQLLDMACAWCVTHRPDAGQLGEEALLHALESTVGHNVVLTDQLTHEGVLKRLQEKIIGQDAVLEGISNAFMAGLGSWNRRTGPRGVFLFGGPTGVGKTKTAQLLAEILGGEREALIRVDCNTLQESGGDNGPIRNLLLGVPPGYLGYVRGKGGILSRIRDFPACVVLFDEFEKASAGLGELLLTILQDGRTEDSDGNLLDFRRSYLIFTTNSGCTYEQTGMGFETGEPEKQKPTVDEEALITELRRRVGLGQEFISRFTHKFLFQALDEEAIRRVLEIRLQELGQTGEVRGHHLTWDDELIQHLASQWQPRFGVRFAISMLRNRIGEVLSVLEAQGQLQAVSRVHFAKLKAPRSAKASGLPGGVDWSREGDTLTIFIT